MLLIIKFYKAHLRLSGEKTGIPFLFVVGEIRKVNLALILFKKMCVFGLKLFHFHRHKSPLIKKSLHYIGLGRGKNRSCFGLFDKIPSKNFFI